MYLSDYVKIKNQIIIRCKERMRERQREKEKHKRKVMKIENTKERKRHEET